MSEYRVRANGELKSETDLRLENRNVSFPKVWNTNVFEALGIDPVLAAPAAHGTSASPATAASVAAPAPRTGLPVAKSN